jgi:hypothetical protein
MTNGRSLGTLLAERDRGLSRLQQTGAAAHVLTRPWSTEIRFGSTPEYAHPRCTFQIFCNAPKFAPHGPGNPLGATGCGRRSTVCGPHVPLLC